MKNSFNECKTQKDKIEFVRHKILSDDRWAIRALIRVYRKQTHDEQSVKSTHDSNGVGFTHSDAKFFSAMAERANNNLSLSQKQLYCIRNGMAKYARQIVKYIM